MELSVQFAVADEVGDAVAGRAGFPDDLQLIGRECGNRGAKRLHFQRRPELEDFARILDRQRHHERAAARMHGEKALGFQPLNGFAQGDVADAEFGGQCMLRNARTGLQRAIQDRFSNLDGGEFGY